MSGQKIDRDKLRASLRNLPNQEIYCMLGEALEMLPPPKLEKLVKRCIDLSQLRSDSPNAKCLLDEVKAFEEASLRGDYYESFDVNSKNCTELSKGTRAWIFEFNRLLDRCITGTKKDSKSETREAIEICFGLLRHIDEGMDDVIFFADEGGSWQVGVDWPKVLPAYFACLSATAPLEEYVSRVIGIVDEFQHYDRDRHLRAARRVGTATQRQSLKKRLSAEVPPTDAGVL